MSTSNTFDFSLTNAEVVTSAYALLQIRRPSLLAEHLADARVQLNLLLSSWSNLQVNLFNVDLVTVPLVAGTATYSVPASTIMILDAYLSYGSPSTDRILGPISRTDYASYPNKDQQGVPTVFWLNRQINPTITLWTVPDSTQSYTLKYYRCYQNQDANLPAGETPAIPYRWLDAVVSGLAARLARIYAPTLADQRSAEADKAWQIAAAQDVEDVPLYVVPQIGYYRT